MHKISLFILASLTMIGLSACRQSDGLPIQTDSERPTFFYFYVDG